MRITPIIDLVGKPISGICIDSRTRMPDGSLMYEHTEKDGPHMRTLDKVEIVRKKDGDWLYWRFQETHFGCNYSGLHIEHHEKSGRLRDYCLMMPD